MCTSGGKGLSQSRNFLYNNTRWQDAVSDRQFRYFGCLLNEKLNLSDTATAQTQRVKKAYHFSLSQFSNLRPQYPLVMADRTLKQAGAASQSMGQKFSEKDNEIPFIFFRRIFPPRTSLPVVVLFSLTGNIPRHLRHICLQLNFIQRALSGRPDNLLYCAVISAVETSETRETSWLRRALQPVELPSR